MGVQRHQIIIAGTLEIADHAVMAAAIEMDPVHIAGNRIAVIEIKYNILNGNLVDKETGTFDVVVANIVADIIILFSSQVGEFLKDDGVFITSGIIEPREEEVTKAFHENNFEIVERYEDGGWLCFVCKKK